jgi:hypothetical protein
LSATARDTPLPSARLVVSPDGRNAAFAHNYRGAPPGAAPMRRFSYARAFIERIWCSTNL